MPRPVVSRQVVARLGGFGVLLGALFVRGLLIAPHSARHFRNEFAVSASGGSGAKRDQAARAAMRILCAPNVSNETMSAAPAAADLPAEITVYTLPWCPHCTRARALLKRRGLTFLLLADADTHEAMGRMANALTSAKESVEAGDEAVVIFDGASTKWVPELESEEHRYHRVYSELREHILGACSYCAQAFGVKDQVEASAVKPLTDYRGHPSLHRLVADDYQVLTF